VLSLAIRCGIALLVGSLCWIVVGYAALIPLGAIFGWSGHPALPAAPLWVYGGLYVAALPILCFYWGWKITKWFAERVG
jgi:hypothetical protein